MKNRKDTLAVQSEELATYNVTKQTQEEMDNDTVNKALGIIFNRLVTKGVTMSSPEAVKSYLSLKMALLEREVFACMFLDTQNRLVAYEELFFGTINQASVYPREVVKAALKLNASGVVFAHNHPSGIAEPSRADELLTTALKQALALIDVRVLDHIVVAGSSTESFAERGLL